MTATYSCSLPFEHNQAGEGIHLIWDHPEFGPIPFLAMPTDVELHGREIYAKARAGEYGPVVSYEDSHWYSLQDGNVWRGFTHQVGQLMISPTGEQPPNSTNQPLPLPPF